jgi:hypothetical protein
MILAVLKLSHPFCSILIAWIATSQTGRVLVVLALVHAVN